MHQSSVETSEKEESLLCLPSSLLGWRQGVVWPQGRSCLGCISSLLPEGGMAPHCLQGVDEYSESGVSTQTYHTYPCTNPRVTMQKLHSQVEYLKASGFR